MRCSIADTTESWPRLRGPGEGGRHAAAALAARSGKPVTCCWRRLQRRGANAPPCRSACIIRRALGHLRSLAAHSREPPQDVRMGSIFETPVLTSTTCEREIWGPSQEPQSGAKASKRPACIRGRGRCCLRPAAQQRGTSAVVALCGRISPPQPRLSSFKSSKPLAPVPCSRPSHRVLDYLDDVVCLCLAKKVVEDVGARGPGDGLDPGQRRVGAGGGRVSGGSRRVGGCSGDESAPHRRQRLPQKLTTGGSCPAMPAHGA
jgi:hypothetical protein